MASVVQRVRPDVYNDPLQPYEKLYKIESFFSERNPNFGTGMNCADYWIADGTFSIISGIREVV